ncbi:MAG: SMC-Scp complex subunit ScpB [Chitinophagaceae bacterium]|nr:SMC-Scp complex subunit ScpB [Chitinophagaceae bacterium]
MTIEEIMLKSEALIFASDRPLTEKDISDLLSHNEDVEEKQDLEKLPAALEAIVEKYAADFYPFEVKQMGGGYQFLSKTTFYPVLEKLNGDKFTKKLSASAMETLAIIAYKQPVTKSQIEFIRGVNSDYSVQKLLEKELIVISGRLEDAVGKPLTYNTSRIFMDYLGINSMDDLPKLSELINQDIVIPTDGKEALPDEIEIEVNGNFVIDESGELKNTNEN